MKDVLLWTWQHGRQRSGYSKMLLAQCCRFFKFDLYLLNFPEGSVIPEHTDLVMEGYRHFRLNIILKRSQSGGEFKAERHIINWDRLKFFRPDLYRHSVSQVVGGNRLVLSFGFLLKDRH